MANKPKSVLQLKIEKKIHYLLLDLFSKSEMSYGDKKFFISINNVDISPNLRNLKIFVEIIDLDNDKKNLVIKDLNKNNSHAIKDLIAKNMTLKYLPEPFFILDDSSEKLFKMSKLIDKEKKNFEDN